MEPKIIVKKPSKSEIDLANSWGTWEKEASEFAWSYDEQETCLILSGKASVLTKGGKEVFFGKGDWVIFPKGLECTWKINEKIIKKYKFG